MALNRRAVWTGVDALYWIFYIPLTFAVAIALVITPAKILERGVQPVSLDAQIMEARVLSTINEYSPVIGSTGGIRPLDEEHLILHLSDKKFGMKLQAGNKTYYANEEFFNDSYPLAPIRYTVFKKRTTIDNQKILIEQVYSPKYESFKGK